MSQIKLNEIKMCVKMLLIRFSNKYYVFLFPGENENGENPPRYEDCIS